VSTMLRNPLDNVDDPRFRSQADAMSAVVTHG